MRHCREELGRNAGRLAPPEQHIQELREQLVQARMADLCECAQASPLQEFPSLDVEATLGHRLHLVALQEGEPIPTSRVGVTQLAPAAGSPLASHARCVGDRSTASWE